MIYICLQYFILIILSVHSSIYNYLATDSFYKLKIWYNSHVIPNPSKTQLNIIPEILFGTISSEFVVSTDIAKCLKNEFSFIQLESIQRRICRFFNNELFDHEDFYNSLIISVISKYKLKHKDKRSHITFDHMFSHDNYVTLRFTMRVGKQGIPIWFKSFKQEYINKNVSLEKGGTICF